MNLALSVVQCRPGEPGEFISSSPRAHLGGPNHGVYKPFYILRMRTTTSLVQ